MDIILELKKLSFSYEEDIKILDQIDLTIREGEKIAVVGANGAGKSTLFLNMNGVLQPDRGEICYRGKKIGRKELKELRKNIGIVFQNADNQIIASTVKQEVAFGPVNLKLSKEEVIDRVEEALEFMQLSELALRPPHYLSGGEKKKVSIADIIAMHAEIIIFDEPTASLDPANQQILESVLADLEKEQKTILIATHDVDFIFRWADRIIVLGEKNVLADDVPDEIFSKEALLKKAHLKKPILMEVHELLKEKNLIGKERTCPRTIEELRLIF